MKKIFILLALFLFSVNSVFAENFMQQKAEKIFKQEKMNAQVYLSAHFLLIQQDYEAAKDTDNSIYSMLIYLNQNAKDQINKTYSQKALNLYNYIAKYDGDAPSTEDFAKRKVYISDTDFNLLSKELINIICLLNTY